MQAAKLKEQQKNNAENILRRSRNDPEGRDYKCQVCEKTYLSYPALYTHMKQKHALDPNGMHVNAHAPRMRGRPKKGDYTRTDPTSDKFLSQEGKMGGPTDPLHNFEEACQKVLGTSNTKNEEP